ncbi:MAG: hypothetical protein KBF74_05805 [Ferruginibacter sp.]|nr:hypothetical protein [Ferruginibacter sp.]
MKKISSIKQLEEEKQKLFRRQLELEKVIKYDWRDVKESFNPLHIANSIISGFNKKRIAKTNTLLLRKIFLKCFQIIPES